MQFMEVPTATEILKTVYGGEIPKPPAAAAAQGGGDDDGDNGLEGLDIDELETAMEADQKVDFDEEPKEGDEEEADDAADVELPNPSAAEVKAALAEMADKMEIFKGYAMRRGCDDFLGRIEATEKALKKMRGEGLKALERNMKQSTLDGFLGLS